MANQIEIPKLEHTELVAQWQNMGAGKDTIDYWCRRLDKFEYDFRNDFADRVYRGLEEIINNK